MKKSWFMLILLCQFNSAWSLPWFTPPNQDLHPAKKVKSGMVNFSGSWVGECNQQPATNMTIRQVDDKLLISYGFMEEKYTLEEVKSTNTTRANSSIHGNTFVTLDNANRALIFINADLFKNPTTNLNAFFSKVVMVLDNDYLMVKGLYYHTQANTEDFQQQLIACVYRRVA
ncbi:MAG: hypothetical protein EPN84_01040 [Legionella sp.]|nr:MAG: hypothetical protein EPN84_01040 [Legionella sp.]